MERLPPFLRPIDRFIWWHVRPRLSRVWPRLERMKASVLRPPEVGVWRVNGARPRSLRSDGSFDRFAQARNRDELRYWLDHFRPEEGVELPFGIADIEGWQRDRVALLRDWLEIEEDAFERWCAERVAVEIGSGPIPCVGFAPWGRAFAVDPLAEGYASERLVPESCADVVFIPAPGEHIPLLSGSADVVIFENALDHVDSPRRVLREIVRLLAPGGLVWFLVDLMEVADWMHPNPMSEARLRSLLEEAGLEPVREQISTDHKSHVRAYGEYRGLLRKRSGAAD